MNGNRHTAHRNIISLGAIQGNCGGAALGQNHTGANLLAVREDSAGRIALVCSTHVSTGETGSMEGA